MLSACDVEAPPEVAPGSSPASFLLVTLDTTRADHLEPYGATDVETPVLQALTQGGVVFERAYATTPVTLPSHASIFTGLDPPSHGVRNNGIHHLGPASTTLAEVLAEEGYRTAAFVSAAVLEKRYGLDQGFEVYDDDLAAGRPKVPRMVAERPAEVTVAAARRWLDLMSAEKRDAPFFLWVHLFDPHAVYAPPEPFATSYRDRPYDGEIAYVDAQLGRLLEHPRLSSDELLVMVIADHGESLGEHGEASHAMLAYDATLRIPWIVRPPGGEADAPPLRLRHEVSQIDLLPTALDLLDLAGALEKMKANRPLDGTSQASAIRSQGVERGDERALYAETLVPFYSYGWAQLRSLRRAGWKWIEGPAPELYHLPADPGERHNLVASEGGRARQLRDELAHRGEDSNAANVLTVDAATQEKLRSLGYLAARDTSDRKERPDPKSMIEVHRALETAQAALYRHDLEHAAVELRQVLERDPDNLTALADLAKTMAEQGDLVEAMGLARRALALDPESADLVLGLGVLLGRNGDYQPALQAVEAALAIDPKSLDAGLEKVRALHRLGRRDQAVALLRSLAAEHPGEPRIDIGLAELVEAPAGEVEAAEARLRRAVEREPYRIQGWRILGRLLADDRPDEAVAVYRQGLTFQPRDLSLRAHLGVLLARAGSPKAEEHLRAAAASLSPPSVEVHSALAALELQRGRWADAETQARRVVELEPNHAEGWNHLAIALEEQDQAQLALAAYQRALAADSEHWRARFNQGLLLKKLGRFRAAAEAFRVVLEQQPSHAKSHYELGVLYGGSLGDPQRATEHLRRALQLEPEHPRVELVRRLLKELTA